MESLSSKKRLLILGDSLCLPRNQPEKVSLYQTWPFLLNKNANFEIIQIALGGGTLKNIYEQSAYYIACEPDIVIIQSGIVDCAPRALGWIEKEIISAFRPLGFLFHHFFPINLMRKFRKITYTKKTDFRKLIKELINRFSNSQIIWIGIVPACNEYEKTVPGITQNIDIYNKIIASGIADQHGVFLNVNSIPLEGIMSDHHHLNSIAHKWLYEKILSHIHSIDNRNE